MASAPLSRGEYQCISQALVRCELLLRLYRNNGDIAATPINNRRHGWRAIRALERGAGCVSDNKYTSHYMHDLRDLRYQLSSASNTNIDLMVELNYSPV